jgi:hypothetical protein
MVIHLRETKTRYDRSIGRWCTPRDHTRATRSVILVGDEALLRAAVERQLTAANRRVGLQCKRV